MLLRQRFYAKHPGNHPISYRDLLNEDMNERLPE